MVGILAVTKSNLRAVLRHGASDMISGSSSQASSWMTGLGSNEEQSSETGFFSPSCPGGDDPLEQIVIMSVNLKRKVKGMNSAPP